MCAGRGAGRALSLLPTALRRQFSGGVIWLGFTAELRSPLERLKMLGAELGGTGVTANAVSPGSTDTPILTESARLYGMPGAASFAAQQPARRLLDPAEIAAVLAFLAGSASSAMTGAVVAADGGLAL